MCNILQVQWTIVPRFAPQPWIACNGCGGLRPFRCSGKIRLNANGRKLDAWLIYKCSTCDKTWNRPIFERQNVRDIHPETLEAMQSNDPGWIRTQAFDLAALRRKSQRIDEFADVDVQKALLCSAEGWTMLEIRLVVPLPASMRLDRLLATELGLSRSWLQALDGAGRLQADPNRKDALRRPPKNQSRIRLDFSDEIDRLSVCQAAGGSVPGQNRDREARSFKIQLSRPNLRDTLGRGFAANIGAHATRPM
ncbi:DUF1062 domain-containing protein [Sinorhizobium sp. CB9]